MREEPCDLEGTRLVLEHPDELATLPPALRRLVPSQLRQLFRKGPGALTEVASNVEFAPLARWLRTMARA
ncbi:MAG TPA: hypothetical protein VL400_04090, partial [Polyangiaceae bacterium]|nr:hypothetical protein [Polyangiaceae bacterium]